MKTSIITFIAVLGAFVLFGQNETQSEAETQSDSQEESYIEIGDEKMETFTKSRSNGGYIGLQFQYKQIDGENALVGGVKLAYIMNHNLEIGLAAQGNYALIEHQNFNDDVHVWATYGGLHIAPVIAPLKRVHLAFPILIGAGAVGYEEDFNYGNGNFEYEYDVDEIFVAQVGANVVFNITRFFQVEVGAQYLHTTDINLSQLPGVDINGVSGGFGLRFGWF